VLLELACLLSSSQESPLLYKPIKYLVQLVAFDMDELGLLGSSQYAADLKKQQQPPRLMISVAMLGYTDLTPGS
jgi:Zn-dependent M28 family amino/carboxypeptidase